MIRMDSGNNNTNTVPPFLSKTYDMVDDPSTDSVVSWSSSNNSFVVWNVPEFQTDLLPKYFKHSNFSSFVRQLNTYGFRKVDPDRFEFANEGFLRGQKHLLRSISRKKPVHGNLPPQVQSSSVTACVEVGKFGLEEEVERLKRDKNVLMQELVRLRQQQQATDHQLHTVGQRVQGMEQRQQQMMSFLAKAMQSPGFLSQLVQQQNESTRRIAGASKKRRLPRQEEENLAGVQCKTSPNGQIINFHSSMNEAAKAMLHQILKMNSSPRLEPSMNNSGPLLIGNHPSSNGLDSGSSSTRMSGVMLSEVPTASGPSYLPMETGFPASHATTAISEVQSSASVATDYIKTDYTAEMGMHNSGENTILPNFTAMTGIVPGGSAGGPNMNIAGSEEGNAEFFDSMSSVLDAPVPEEIEALSPSQDEEVFLDGNPKLPGINDVFWEQFLTTSPLNGETDEINSSSPESSMSKEHELQSWQDNGWDNIQHMNRLAEQMGLLTPESLKG